MVVAAVLAASPAAALAQDAGDEQYTDPFGNGGTQQSDPGGQAEKPNVTSTPQGQSQGAGSSSGTTTGAGTAGTSAEPSAPAASTVRGELPRTGLDVRLVALLGIGLLLTGTGVRLRLSR